MVAAWRRGGTVDNVLTPTFMSLGAFPAFFTSLLAVYFLGLKLGWFPIQHAYDLGTEPGFNWHVHLERLPARAAADPRDRPRLRGRLAARACAT